MSPLALTVGRPASSQATIPPSHDADVLVAESAEQVGDPRGAVVRPALEQEALGAIRGELVDPLGDLGLRDVDRPLEMGLVPLVLLADVDQAHAGFDLPPGVRERDHLDPLLDLLDRFRSRRHCLKLQISIGIRGLLQKV